MTAVFPPGREAPPPIYNGRYELRSQIARGGTAQVYLARDLLLDRPVALKVLFPELSTDSSFVERFRREAQAAANLSHPNIVPIFDWGESERTYFIVMEHVDGEPLSSLIRSQAPLPPLQAVAIAADISKALSYAHRHGVVHRDVKPGNVLITRDGQVKVADFGIARAVGADESVTQTGLVMGTATYFSPEQAQGLGVDGRSDVYSLGVVLYEMVTGRPPFVADTPVAIAYKHVSETPVPPREIEPRLPPALEAVILKAMAKSPANRYATADDFHADLDRFARGAHVQAEVGGAAGAATVAIGAAGVAAAGTATVVQGEVGTAAVDSAGGPGGASPGGTAAVAQATGPDGEPEMPKRRWIVWTLAGLLLLVLLAGLIDYGAHQLGYAGEPYISMPGVVGKNVAAAVTQLDDAGLKAVKLGNTSHSPKYQVLSTSPSEGTQVRKGSSVTVFYSLGLPTVVVPPVDQENYRTAEATLRSAHLNPKLVPTAPVPGEQIGLVTNVSPPVGTTVDQGSTVVLTYTTGSPTISVPDVNNLTVKMAIAKLNGAGLIEGTQTTQISTTVPSGEVISSNPASGTKVKIGTSVALLVSAGQGISVPNVTGKTKAEAISALTGDHLGYTIVFDTNVGPSQVGNVISQNPAPNQRVPSGTSVTLTIGGSRVQVGFPGNQTDAVGRPITQVAISANSTIGGGLHYTASGLPPGLHIDPNTGVISGTPSQRGSFSVTVTATDSTGATGSTSFTWVVTAATSGSG